MSPLPPEPPRQDDEIDAYLRSNIDRFTDDALRARLIDAGHDLLAIRDAFERVRPSRGIGAAQRRPVAVVVTALAYAGMYVVITDLIDNAGWDSRMDFSPMVSTIFSFALGGMLLISLLGLVAAP